MFFKVMGVTCDEASCHAETFRQGRDANIHKLTEIARREGWAISSAGHYCPDHRYGHAKER